MRRGSLLIHDAINDSPNTASLTVDTTAPSSGQDVRITINSETPRLLFNGTIQTDDLSYEGKPTQEVYPVSAIDDLARLNRKRPFGTWTLVSATTIAQSLIATYAPGFTSTHVQASLPAISIIFDGSESFGTCLGRIAQAIGGYFYLEDVDLHLFTSEATDAPDPIDHSHPFLNDPPITVQRDDSQIRTRVYGKGHGEAVLSDVAALETILPIADAVMFNPAGGHVIAGTTPDGAQSQILTYTGIQLGAVGSLVGPGAEPSVKPSAARAIGGSLTAGDHLFAYTWVTAAGETTPSPVSAVLPAGAYTPPTPVTPDDYTYPTNAGATTLTIGASYTYKAAFRDASLAAVSALSVASAAVVALVSLNNGTKTSAIFITVNVPDDPLIDQVDLYRSENGGAYQFVASNNTFTPPAAGLLFTDFGPTGGAAYPGSSSASYATATLSGIAIGPAGTTSRKVYQTAAGGVQLKLQQTIANNTATTATASAADGSLGANVPTSNTSGLTTAAGQVNAGSASIETVGWPFGSAGWAVLGSQLVRYTGLTGNTLTGIPASGIGALVNTVKYGEHIDVAPALTGVSGLSLAIQKGSAVHLWVQRDDLAAQSALAAIDLAQGRLSDGVVEHLISDGRRGEDSLIAVCNADLALFSRAILTVTYDTRDVKSKSGKPIVINLTQPPISATLTIQSVDISEIDIADGLAPRFHVTASSVRFSLEDMLRRMAATG